jgi:hypothetical protein
MTFISSSCLCTTNPEFASSLAAGCRSLRAAFGSSGIWTGDRRLFWVEERGSTAEVSCMSEFSVAGFPGNDLVLRLAVTGCFSRSELRGPRGPACDLDEMALLVSHRKAGSGACPFRMMKNESESSDRLVGHCIKDGEDPRQV